MPIERTINMYRDKLEQLRKEYGYSYKKWSEESGVSVDTLDRIVHPENPDKDSPRISSLEQACKPFNIEIWQLFYPGDPRFVTLQAEIDVLISERDALLRANEALTEKIGDLTRKVEDLKDELIATHKHYNKIN
jgi:transcriptional regulator with XRE-family HTH domain